MIAIGTFIMLVAADWIVVDPSSIEAPRWVLGLAGLVFLMAGLMVLAGQKSRINDGLAAMLLFAFAAIGAYAALLADPASIEGGLPLIDKETNSLIGRWVFGIGALMSAALGVYALRRCFRASS